MQDEAQERANMLIRWFLVIFVMVGMAWLGILEVWSNLPFPDESQEVGVNYNLGYDPGEETTDSGGWTW